jgi:hypothetical protein
MSPIHRRSITHTYERVWFNGRTSASQAESGGSIPLTRSTICPATPSTMALQGFLSLNCHNYDGFLYLLSFDICDCKFYHLIDSKL